MGGATDVTGQLDRTVGLLQDVLGPDLLGTCLHGSAVLGGLKPASDLDILAVTRRSLDEHRRRALLAGVLEISGLTARVRPVELTVVVQSEIRPWRYPPTADFLYGEWLREELSASGPPHPPPGSSTPCPDESWSEELAARVRPHVDEVLARIDRLRGGAEEAPPPTPRPLLGRRGE